MKIKKSVSVLMLFALLAALIPAVSFTAAAIYAPLPQAPRIVSTIYPTDDVVVADIVLTEAPYLAGSGGLTDCTQILQSATARAAVPCSCPPGAIWSGVPSKYPPS